MFYTDNNIYIETAINTYIHKHMYYTRYLKNKHYMYDQKGKLSGEKMKIESLSRPSKP